jgi:hypothetical protein
MFFQLKTSFYYFTDKAKVYAPKNKTSGGWGGQTSQTGNSVAFLKQPALPGEAPQTKKNLKKI